MTNAIDRETRRIVHNPPGKPEGWYVVSESGDHCFNDKPYGSKAEAEKLLEAVEAHKHAHARGLDRDDREKRYAPGIELRMAPEGQSGPGTLVGYPIVHDSRSEVLTDRKTGRRFVEVVRPGAATRSLREGDIRAMMDHDPGRVLGRNKSGTLRLVEDERGVRCEIDLPDTTAGRDCAVSVARRDLTGMSFGFRTPRGGDSWDLSGDTAMRHLHDIDVEDVSVVAYPAYPDTEVAIRSLLQAEGEAIPEAVAGPDPAERRAALLAQRAGIDAELVALDPPAAPTPEPATPPGPDPAAVRRELERDRDLLKILGIG